MPVSKSVDNVTINGYVCGNNVSEFVILWDDNTFERISRVEFTKIYGN